MSRLQKKCLLASTALHGLVILAIVFVPVLAVSRLESNPEDLPVLEFIPAKAIDEAFSGGGKPLATTPQPPKPLPPEPIPPVSRNPQVNPPEKKNEPATPPRPTDQTNAKEKQSEPEPIPAKSNKSEPDAAPARPSRKPIQVDLSNRVSNNQEKVASRQDRSVDTAAKNQRQIAQQFSKTLRELDSQLSTRGDTAITMPGPGGEAYANYSQIVRSIYFQAWSPPDELSDESATAEAKVVIARNGTVISAALQRRSGNSLLDKSVERALQIEFVAPFPDGAKDSQRTFNLNFNLKAKRLRG